MSGSPGPGSPKSEASVSLAPSDAARVELVIAEYESLRAEILKLIELQSQLIGLTVLALGTILSVGLQAHDSALVFVYPPLALVLGITWLNHSHAIARCAAYLSQELEPRCGQGVLGWEGYVRRHPLRFGMIGYWGMRSVFMASSLTALVVGWILSEGRSVELVVGIASSLITMLTIWLFFIWREPSPRRLRREEDQAEARS